MPEQIRNPAKIIALIALVMAALPFLNWVPDDAYISFQYARSAAEGDGLVFNPGERVEGYSNLLWTLLLSVAARAGADVAVWAPILGLLCAAGAVILFVRSLTTWLGGTTGAHRLILGFAGLLLGSYFPLAFYATSGLETPFYLLLLIAGVSFYARGRATGNGAYDAMCVLAFLAAALTRPEAIVFLLMHVYLVSRNDGRAARLTGIVALLVYGVVLLTKYDFYGAWLPNTYFAKPGLSVSYGEPVVRGLRYLARFFIKSGLLFIVVVALLPPRDTARRPAWLYLWALVAIQIGFIVFVGGDVLRFDRFTVPLFPWLLALAAMALNDRLPQGRPPLARRTGQVALFVTVVVLALNIAQSYRANSKYCVHDWMHANTHAAIGRLVADMVPSAVAIVTNEVGAVRYYSGIPVVDMLGLTDATVSSIRFESFQEHGLGSSEASVAAVSDYLFRRQPAVVLLPATQQLNFEQRSVHASSMHPLWYGIFTHPTFVRDFSPTHVVRVRDDKFIYVYLRNDVTANAPPLPEPQRCMVIESM